VLRPFYPRDTPRLVGWVDPRAAVETVVAKTQIPAPTGNRTPAIKLVSRYFYQLLLKRMWLLGRN